MASFSKRVKHVKHYEYEMPTPVHLSEFSKALAVARVDIASELGNDLADEVVRVEARDDKVVITWWSEGEESA